MLGLSYVPYCTLLLPFRCIVAAAVPAYNPHQSGHETTLVSSPDQLEQSQSGDETRLHVLDVRCTMPELARSESSRDVLDCRLLLYFQIFIRKVSR